MPGCDHVRRTFYGKILQTGDGKEAIDLLEKNHDISLGLIDIKMPDMNGLEVAKIIRKSKRKIFLIAQPAYSFNEEVEEIMSAGFDRILLKPLSHEKLLEMINIHSSSITGRNSGGCC